MSESNPDGLNAPSSQLLSAQCIPTHRCDCVPSVAPHYPQANVQALSLASRPFVVWLHVPPPSWEHLGSSSYFNTYHAPDQHALRTTPKSCLPSDAPFSAPCPRVLPSSSHSHSHMCERDPSFEQTLWSTYWALGPCRNSREHHCVYDTS